MEVAARDDVAVLNEDQRIVGDGVGFTLQHGGGVAQHVQRRAHDLRLAAQGVGVLHLGAVVAVAVADGAAVQQFTQTTGDVDLTRLAAQGVDAMVERRVRAQQGVDRQAARSDGGGEHVFGREQAGQGQSRRALGAVQQGQAFLGTQDDGLQSRLGQGGHRVQHLTLIAGLADADQDARHMGQRRQIARGADRTLGRDQRQDLGVDHADQRLQRVTTYARGALRQAGDLQHHQQAGGVFAQRLADAAGVAEHQVLLKGFKVFRRNAGVGQQAEAGVDAIDRAAFVQNGGDGRRAFLDIGPGGGGEFYLNGAVQGLAQLIKSQRVLADDDLGHFFFSSLPLEGEGPGMGCRQFA